ncbi:ABC transporter ATP-binding protein [Salisaeta longa]|uniref:ABC transporter ATP-binding protein n=1 Tax=Salisaeta longa TaxID=503170 RepID=UPI0003B4CD1D|nr:ABC transporter ATP-binding protein [Salisaeta longa]
MLHLTDLSKRYGDERVLRDVSLTVHAQETLAVLGRSGSGKTTLLKIVAGLEPADAGTIALDGRDISKESAQNRGIIYLNQEPLLFPHLTVFENVAFGLRLRNVDAAAVKRRALRMLSALGLSDHRSKSPDQLSGGQRQRVAFGRAIIVKPPLLLLDEPFSNLDVAVRRDMQDLFQRLARAHGISTMFVTHDLKEALRMGDRLALIRDGALRVYPSKEAFIADPSTGVQDELAFWNELPA